MFRQMNNMPFGFDSLANLRNSCSKLPVFEFKFHLLHLIDSLQAIQNTDLKNALQPQVALLVQSLDETLNSYLDFLEGKKDLPPTFEKVTLHYQKLCDLNKHHTIFHQFHNALLKTGAVILALICGILGASIGTIAGLLRSPFLAWKSNSISTFFTETKNGMLMGTGVGGLIGYRLPMKLKDSFRRKLKLSLDSIHECIIDLEQHPQIIQKELNELKNTIKLKYFNNDEVQYHAFAAQKNVPFELCTVKATFVSPHLEDYLGHHAFIKLTCKDKDNQFIFYREDGECKKENQIPLTLEFNTSPTDLSRRLSQTDKRSTTGQAIIDMLIIGQYLISKHERKTTIFNIASGGFDLKPGDRDCFTYIEKILAATNQNKMEIYRSDGTENWVGNFIGHAIRFLSAYEVPSKKPKKNQVAQNLVF